MIGDKYQKETKRQLAVAATGGQKVGVSVLLKRDKGQLPDADCGGAEGEHQNRGGIIISINEY